MTRAVGHARRPRSLRLYFAIVVLIAACSNGSDGSDMGSQQPEPVRLAQSTPAQWAQPVLAAANGSYDAAGVAVRATEFSSGRDALQALAGGAADIATATPSNVAPAVINGAPLVVFGVLATVNDWRLLAGPGSGIQDPEDLVGKSVGVPLGTSADQSLDVLLGDAGLDRDDVRVVNVSPPDLVPALKSRSVDAISIWQPNLTAVESAVAGTTSLSYEMPNSFLLVTTRAYYEQHPEILKRFLSANRAVDGLLAEGSQDVALDVMAPRVRLDREVLRAAWTDFVFRTAEPDTAVLDQLEAAADFYRGTSGSSQAGPQDFRSLLVTVGLD